MHYLPQLNWNGWGRQSGKNPRAAGGAAAAANLLPVCDWMPCFYSDSPDLHHRCNKWEHILGILVQIECLWGVFFGGLPLASKGELIACALVILFFPIHSVIRDPFFSAFHEKRDLVQFWFLLFYFPPSILPFLWAFYFDLDGKASRGQKSVRRGNCMLWRRLCVVIMQLEEDVGICFNEVTAGLIWHLNSESSLNYFWGKDMWEEQYRLLRTVLCFSFLFFSG